MIGTPILGWIILSADGWPVPFFGWQLPPFVGNSEAITEWAEEIHETVATAGYFLVGLHATAALFHPYVMRGKTLRRMLPGRW